MKRRFLAICMATSLAVGSMGAFSVAHAEDTGITNIVVEMVNYGFDDADLQMVEDAMNEITEAEIGVHVHFLTVPISEMATKLGLQVAAGEQIDLTCTGLLTSPITLVNEGLLQPITEYINNSEVLSSKAGDMLKATTVNGEIYAYPGGFYTATGAAYFYDKDLAEEYNIDIPDHMDSEDELTAIFQQVVDSGMPMYPFTMGDGVNTERNYGITYEGLGDSTYASYGVVEDPQNGTEVVDWYETEEYQKQSRTHQEWFEKGYVVPDSISNGYVTYDSIAQGQCFSSVGAYSTGTSEAFMSTMTGRNIGAVIIGDTLLDTTGIINTSWGVPSTSEHAEEAVKFVELLYSNLDLLTLYRYGIEGVHYVKTDNSNEIAYPEGVDSSSVGYGAFIPLFTDEAELPVLAPLTEDFYETVESLGMEKANVSKFLGYTFDPTNVSTQVSAVTAAVSEYGPSLSCGVVDFDTIYPEFIDSLKAAGIDEIIAENQKQLDAWLAAQES